MLRVRIRGIVQGVGFRPFVFRLAQELGLKGYVLNSASGVEIEVEGRDGSLSEFLHRLRAELPPIARIDELKTTELPDKGYENFTIRESSGEGGGGLISPDLATCSDCLDELRNPDDRRHHYPFINCTNCGPRYSIIIKTPYDRINTTMRIFKMCPDCDREYRNPNDRRFHAQPNACPRCGPELIFLDRSMQPVDGDPILLTQTHLKAGKIVGIKGIGGFHIAVDPRVDGAVAELRRRKNRPHKPFAVMVRKENLSELVEPESMELLSSVQAPILLLRKNHPSPISPLVAPANPYLGVFLPYAPVHHLLLDDDLPYLIMTSGNLADEPIARDESELKPLCDFYLTNNRPIENRIDDSIINPTRLGPVILRRARGFVPDPIDLPLKTIPTLACGGELKGTFALAEGDLLYLSPHLGDLESKKTMDFFKEALKRYREWFGIRPELIACDLHPDYLTTRFAENLDLPLVRIQHHHAHIASVLVDNCRVCPVIGVAYDGTGYGEDGRIWGGEILVGDIGHYQRRFHLRYLPLPGGDRAIKRPIRIALAYLIAAGIDPSIIDHDPQEAELIRRQLRSGFNVHLTSSMGRLFDCVSALIGLFTEISFEAQAAMALEYLAGPVVTDRIYPYNITEMAIDPIPILAAIVTDIKAGVDPAVIARRFHNTIVAITKDAVTIAANETGIKTIALSGGVFQNRIILEGIGEELSRSGFEVLIHHKLPPNDGGISAGQVVIANVSRRSS